MPATTPPSPPDAAVVDTPRLTLVPCFPAHVLALIEQPERFAEVSGLGPADELRGFMISDDVSPAWIAALRTSSGPDPWRHGFFIIEREARRIVGFAGFKGPPDADGMVEIAYGVVPSREGRGYATEAAAALMRFASADDRVRLIRAHTLPEANASTRVLTKCGFLHIADVVDPDDGPVWRWERSAPHIGAP